jgi:hypothetical protein
MFPSKLLFLQKFSKKNIIFIQQCLEIYHIYITDHNLKYENCINDCLVQLIREINCLSMFFLVSVKLLFLQFN